MEPLKILFIPYDWRSGEYEALGREAKAEVWSTQRSRELELLKLSR
jgi:hypothetical protein